MKIFLKQHKSYYILITILLLNFCYLIIRTTPITNYIAQIIKTNIAISSTKIFTMRDFLILLFFMIGCLACFFLPQKYYQLITKKVKVIYIFIGLFFIGAVIFQFTKTQWLFGPDLRSDDYSYIWEDGKKTQTIHMNVSDEAAYITTAKVIKENSFKNYFHLHELEKYPEGVRSTIWRCIRLHPPLYFYYLSLFPNEIWMRFGNFLVYTILMIFVYLIAKKIVDEKIAIITAVLYWAAPYFFIRAGLKVSNDLFVSLFVAIAIYFVLNYHRQRQLMLSGLFTAIALLSKYTAIFSIPCIVFYILLKNKKNPKKIVLDSIVFLSPIILIFGTWILSLIGTEIGQSQYNIYIKQHFIGTITQPDQIMSKTSSVGQTWITLLFAIPNSFGLGVILLALLGSYSLIRSAKLRLFENFELLTLISMMFVFIVGAIIVNPLLRYSMPGLFVIPLLAAFGIQDFLETEKTKIMAVLLVMNFLVAKTSILIFEYPY